VTQDEIIEMARQASAGNDDRNVFFDFVIEELIAFAKLVAEKEREACAKVCDDIHAECEAKDSFSSYAEAIRARGEA